MNRFTTMTLIFTLALIHQMANADPAQMTVRYSDLDLNRTEGVKILYHRLQHAAEAVCTPNQNRNLATKARFDQCIQSNMQAAVTQIDRPLLSAYFQAQSTPANPAAPAPVRLVQK
jgi:UrcA family protein